MSTKTAEPEPYQGGAKYNSVYDQSTVEIYDQWAADGYDAQIAANSICCDNLVAKFFSLVKADAAPLKILDAGCGTGRVGEVCQRDKNNVAIDLIDGIDYSQGMLDVAKTKNAYNNLTVVDLTKPFDPTLFPTNTYDAMLCSGVFLQGHVGPEAIPELSRVVKVGGLLCFTVRPTFFEKTKTEWESALERAGVDVLEIALLEYTKDFPAPYLMCRKRE